jgi:methanogenic corrinoid protein MtbC1
MNLSTRLTSVPDATGNPHGPAEAPSTPQAGLEALTIAAVERDTGIGKDTLRAWERRHGFPAPWRDSTGERRYPMVQVHRLRVVARLLDAGLRAGQVVPLPLGALQALAGKLTPAPAKTAGDGLPEPELAELLAQVGDADARGLSQALERLQSRLGPAGFVTQVVAPLNQAVGEAWLAGRLRVHQEHLYTETVQRLMRQALLAPPAAGLAAAPRVLLTTLPGEPHGLGLLMAETLLVREGATCRSLGPQTPVHEVVAAAAAHRADIVALSCSGCMPANDLIGALTDLRQMLGRPTEIWAGGGAPTLQRRGIDGVRPVVALEAIAAEVQRWRGEEVAAAGPVAPLR